MQKSNFDNITFYKKAIKYLKYDLKYTFYELRTHTDAPPHKIKMWHATIRHKQKIITRYENLLKEKEQTTID